MAYEFDEWGGHTPRVDPASGATEYPMLGCAAGCPAHFYNWDARSAHIATMHPEVKQTHTPDMIDLARARPELAESMGMKESDYQMPKDVSELERMQQGTDKPRSERMGLDEAPKEPSVRNFFNRPVTEEAQNRFGHEPSRDIPGRQQSIETLPLIAHMNEFAAKALAHGVSKWGHEQIVKAARGATRHLKAARNFPMGSDGIDHHMENARQHLEDLGQLVHDETFGDRRLGDAHETLMDHYNSLY